MTIMDDQEQYDATDWKGEAMHQPTAAELLEAMAVLIVKNDALRVTAGKHCLSQGRVTFDREALERGRSLAPTAFINEGNCLVVKLES